MQRQILHKAEMERASRLRQARIKAGFRSAAEAARRLGVPYGTYSGHESGLRGIRDHDVTAYAKAFGVSVAWLAYGEFSETRPEWIEVKGCLDGPEVIVTSYVGASRPRAILPSFLSPQTDAIEVFNTPINRPFPPNSIIYYDSIPPKRVSSYIGILAMCELADEAGWTLAVLRKGIGGVDFESPIGGVIQRSAVDYVFPVTAIIPIPTELRMMKALGIARSEREGEMDPMERWGDLRDP